MKTILIAGFILACSPAFAQNMDASKVPAAAKSSFSKSFPKATNVKWEKEDGNYEAGFTENGREMAATFDEKGTWLETESKIAISALPKGVVEYVEKNYKGQKIKGAEKLSLPNNEVQYEAEIKGADLIFDANGKFVKSKKG